MKSLLSQIVGAGKNQKQKLFSNNREEAIIKQGREQFKKLLEKGLSVPVALL